MIKPPTRLLVEHFYDSLVLEPSVLLDEVEVRRRRWAAAVAEADVDQDRWSRIAASLTQAASGRQSQSLGQRVSQSSGEHVELHPDV
ncbi:hypothetical protein [Lentzea terrae]|uniref:hypothetical protein n=1 Tax=Lentzea terrae TaxID=2200761 RepID=UPI000DD46454|nr:hypothetical protein [Lentzea terrae]